MKTDILLIHPPTNLYLVKEPIQLSSHIGYGLLHVAACLAQRGYRVTVWNLEDALRNGISLENIQRSFNRCDPLLVGVELNWVAFSRGAIQIAELLKAMNPDIPVILGGTHATIFATEIVHTYHPTITGVLKGEAEKTFADLVENLENKNRIVDVGGLVTFDGKVREVPRKTSDIYLDIDDLPPYSQKVIQSVVSGMPLAAPSTMRINTCRGPCRYKCVYCIGRHIAPLSGRRSFSVHSPEWIIDQINLLMDEGTKGALVFQDYLFLSGKKRLTELAQVIKRERIHEKVVGMNMTAIPGILDRETLHDLSKAGINNIDYGAESGSNRVLRLIKRPTSREMILDAVKATISSGIIPITWWMTGLPGEKPEDIRETAKLINETTNFGAIPAWITPLVILPKTELFDRAYKFGVKLRLKSFEDFSIYSDIEMKSYTWYSEAMSHETEYLDRFAILQVTADLKRQIVSRKEEIIKNFTKKYASIVTSYHPRLTADVLEMVNNQFLESLPKTFF